MVTPSTWVLPSGRQLEICYEDPNSWENDRQNQGSESLFIRIGTFEEAVMETALNSNSSGSDSMQQTVIIPTPTSSLLYEYLIETALNSKSSLIFPESSLFEDPVKSFDFQEPRLEVKFSV